MRLSKFFLAIVGATVLLGALVSSASAGRLSHSATTLNATFARMNFRGGLGTVECEVILNGILHSRTMPKVVLSLMGLITAGNVNRCSRQSATLLRETLPWHVRYDSFGGTLPRIQNIVTRVIGASSLIREPTFIIECLLRATAESPMVVVYNRETGAGPIRSASVGGSIRCGEIFTYTLEGTTTNVTESGGTRVTVTLI